MGGNYCQDHSSMCENIGMINEGIKGLSDSMNRLLSQSAEHYDAEKELRKANEEQNVKLAIICEKLETKKEVEKEEKTDKKEEVKIKKTRQWSIVMSILGPIIGALIVFILTKIGIS